MNEQRGGIYVASRTKHAELWRALRASGAPITCSWLDKTPRGMFDADMLPGQVLTDEQYVELWSNVFQEVEQCDVCLLFIGPTDMPLKGAFLEAGAALAHGKPVIVVSPDVRGFSFIHHPLVHWVPQLDVALQEAIACTASPAQMLRDAEPPVPMPLCPKCSTPLERMAGGFSGMLYCPNDSCDFEPTRNKEFEVRPVVAEKPARCTRPPSGWYCTRDEGHDGPCAARIATPTIPREVTDCGHPWLACCTGDCAHEHKDDCFSIMSAEIARLEHVVECGGKNA